MDKLEDFKSILGRLRSASDGVEMSIEIAKTISMVNLKSTDAPNPASRVRGLG